MATINALRPEHGGTEASRAHHGKSCTPMRSLTPEDGEAFDPFKSKTVVKLEDGSEAIVAHAELLF